jgi:hypothetical protein
MPVQTAPLQQPTFGIPIQIAPSQQSMIMQVVLTSANTVAHTRSSPHQPINQGGDRTTSNSTGGFCTIAANTSKSIGYFKPVEFVAISPIRSFEHSRFCWSKEINSSRSIAENLRRMSSRNSSWDTSNWASICWTEVSCEAGGLLTVKFRQPSHEFTFGVGINFISYPLVLTPLV